MSRNNAPSVIYSGDTDKKRRVFGSNAFPFLFIIISIVIALSFFRFYLTKSSEQFARDFYKQNLREISTGDTYPLIRQLNNLSSSINWQCIEASKKNKNFFTKSKGACNNNFFRHIVSVKNSGLSNLQVKFTLRLPIELEIAFAAMVLMQLLILVILYRKTKKTTKEKMEVANQINQFKLEEKFKNSKIIAELASQTAHDIKSPLAALDMVMKDISDVPEAKRLLIRSATSRINDIANELLKKNRELLLNKNVSDDNTETLKVTLLPVVLDEIVTEKRMQYRSLIKININLNMDSAVYGDGLFAKIQVNEFKRLCSNILNNAIEALDKSGDITINLHTNDDSSEIHIIDNGKGIPAEVLNKLGQRGETHGKKDGNGLGLYHAKKSVESWGGNLIIKSIQNEGTAIIIELPKCSPPKSFVPQISFKEDSNVVIIDDDESIHQIWDRRLESINYKSHNIRKFHFSSPDSIGEWINANDNANTIFLVDYEYLNHKVNGLDIIQKHGIESSSYLITSRFEEKPIQEKCGKFNIGLIPKSMAILIPLHIDTCTEAHVLNTNISDNILIDDDELIRMIWKSSAQGHGMDLNTYSCPERMFENIDTINKNTTFFIDSRLENGIKGEDVAQKLFDLGYQNLYLATGYEPEQFSHLRIFKGVIGKEPPWL